MMDTTGANLMIPAAIFGFISAAFWFYASLSVSIEKERNYRLRRSPDCDIGGLVEILDHGKRYELIGTMRHQARWSKWGALFAALAIGTQTFDAFV